LGTGAGARGPSRLGKSFELRAGLVQEKDLRLRGTLGLRVLAASLLGLRAKPVRRSKPVLVKVQERRQAGASLQDLRASAVV
jgi:hypothetical protein